MSTWPPHLGLNLDAPGAAACFGDGHDVYIGSGCARRARYGRLVLVPLGLVELGLQKETHTHVDRQTDRQTESDRCREASLRESYH